MPITKNTLLLTDYVRHFVREITEETLPNLTALSHNEVPPGIRIVVRSGR